MIYVYNKQGLQDTILCYFQPENIEADLCVEHHDEIVILKQNKQIIGINIAQASKIFGENISNVFPLFTNIQETAQITEFLISKIGVFPEASLTQQFLIGHVVECVPHPDSDKLSVCQVNVGEEVVQIVCGAKNIKPELFVVVAMVGSMMPSGLVIQPSILRKVQSNGMICSSLELGMPQLQDYPGILELSKPSKVGLSFQDYYMKEMKINE